MIPKLLLTGATGNVGSELAQILSNQGVPFIVASRTSGGENSVAFDFQDPATFAPALEGIERIFLVRPPQLANAKKDFEPFLTAAAKSGIKQIVFLSLLGVENNAFLPHAKIEKLIVESGIPYTFLRASFFMQNLSTTHAPEISEWDEVFVPAGQGATSFVDVRDLAAVAAKALTEDGHGFKAYSLTGDVALTYAEVAAILSEVLGRKISYGAPSVFRFARRMRSRGFAWAMIAVMTAIYTVARIGRAAVLTAEVERILGRKPIAFRDFAMRNCQCWEPHHLTSTRV